ncbi:hypothetical protein [Chitinilyticum piscinae]|uniref:Uncharacterized protein n=1 Tax=Chitinilyticum piscinae TaxID=2866724 RepID=A0A8J7K910_9NEIS|nr:hypothetical protein [Chitinilyticum piscinae]MBE9610498.1 hypothetical protein [Chitinilyticum piscinae]
MINPEFSLPLAVPLRFFRTAPLWLLLAGVLFLLEPSTVLSSRHAPEALALTHALMLGFAGNIMLGALLQVAAVVAGVRAARAGLAGLMVWLGLQLGVALLVAGLWFMQPLLLQGAALSLSLTLLPLAGWLFVRLCRSPACDPTSTGLAFSVLALVTTVLLGSALVLVLTRGAALPFAALLRQHVLWGSAGWAGMLLTSVAVTVVPMFLVTPPWPAKLVRLLVPGTFLLLLAMLCWPVLMPLLVLPAAALVLPLWRLLQQSKRCVDPARWLWAWGGLNLLLVFGLSPWQAEDGILDAVVLGGQFLLGGLLPIFTAMLGKIIPFLLWLDYRRQRPLAGPLRHMGQLFPERWLKYLGWLALVAGLCWPWGGVAATAAGGVLLVYALLLLGMLRQACCKAVAALVV